jgi:predicted enzyme related to lactoylglutathione lyase
LIVFPTNDLEKAKALFVSLLGAEPYADTPYYVGFRSDEREIGLDPNGSSNGPIVYWDTDDIAAKVGELTAAGWEVTSEPRNVGGGVLVAQLADGNGSTLGLRQASVT